MKLGNGAYALEVIGAQEEGEYRIARSGKAFRALIDGLYADKHQSIVRELSANAFDSHQRAGEAEPFFVHVPVNDGSDDRANHFYIRDYGVGMSHVTVMTLYSTMFESDKTASNDEVGMFGLGSKTPFAYTDQFYVICYDGETSRHYVSAIGEDGVPRILLMQAEECDEPRGVCVGFTVEDGDFEEFRNAVRQIVLAYTPPFDSNIDLNQYKLPDPVFSGEGWAAYKSQRYARHGLTATWNVRQGCVIYPVEDVGGLHPPADDRYTYLFDAPIGKVTVTTSRERVEYKPETIKFLAERVAEIKQAVKAGVWENIKDIRPVSEFFTAANNLKPSWLTESYTHPITGLTTPTIIFNGLACFYEASEDNYNDRWAYNARKHLTLGYPNSSTVYILKDVKPFLDPERDTTLTEGFTKTEHRRLARFTRAFATAKDSKSVVIAIGVNDWSRDFWECALPKLTRVPVTYEEMKASIPRRGSRVEGEEELTIQAPIRGLGLARASGDTQPVFSIEVDDVSKTAWVKADPWKMGAKKLQAVAKMIGVDNLYVASPSAEDRCKDIRTLSQAVLDHFDKVGLCLTDALKLHEYSYYNKLSALLQFGRYLLKGEKAGKTPTPRPDLYDKLMRIRGALGETYRYLRPFIEHGFSDFDPEAKAGLENYLFKESAGGVKLPPTTKGFKAFEQVKKAFSQNSGNNLALRFLDDLNYSGVQQETPADKLVEALIALNRIVPIPTPVKTQDKP